MVLSLSRRDMLPRVTLNYSITWPEWVGIQRLGQRNRYRWSIPGLAAFFIWRYLLIAFGVVSVLMYAAVLWSSPKIRTEVQPMLYLGICWIVFGLWLRYSQKKRFSQMMLSNLETTIDASGIHTARSNGSESHHKWTAILKTAEDRNAILFFFSKILFIPIPKRAMTEQQQSELRSLIAANVATSGTESISPTQQ
jgi:hypothetical protein